MKTIRHKYRVVICFISVIVLIFFGSYFYRDMHPKFFEKPFKEVTYYDFNEQKYVIKNVKEQKKLQKLLQKVNLTKEFSKRMKVEGAYRFQIKTDTQTMKVGISSKEMSVNGTLYHFDYDISKELQKLILEMKKS